MAIFNRARPIDEVIHNERTPTRIRALLSEIAAIKHFGETRGLKPTRNYTEYVKLDQDAASWVVSACEPLRFKSKEWSFPIVGSFPYLGWFDLEAARDYARELKKEGWDVDLRGARAYSTLGWFRDPVLSSMIPPGEEALGELVNVVLHESVHATIYISGQAYFDESMASFAADEMTYEYLDQFRGKEAPETVAYRNSEESWKERQKGLHEAYEELNRIYQSNRPDAEKLAEKKRILAQAKQRLGIQRDISNATLIQYKTYNTGHEDFMKLFVACGRDWTRFWDSLRTLGKQSFQKSQDEDLAKALQPLIQAGCPTPAK